MISGKYDAKNAFTGAGTMLVYQSFSQRTRTRMVLPFIGPP